MTGMIERGELVEIGTLTAEVKRWRENCEHHQRLATAANASIAEAEENYRAEQVIRAAAEKRAAELAAEVERLNGVTKTFIDELEVAEDRIAELERSATPSIKGE